MSEEPRIEVLVADDEESLRLLLEQQLRQAGCRVDTVANGIAALAAIQERSYDVAILDILMPGMDGIEVLRRISQEEERPEVIVVTGHGTVETALAAMKLGAYDYIGKPHSTSELVLLVRKAWEKRRLSVDNRRLHERVARTSPFPEIVTQDSRMLKVLEVVERVAPSESPILVVGESGTGKELVAQAVHRASGRGSASLIPVNCAALPDTLLESELFGHEKGAFTGAMERKLGLFELADGGTLFMDEIGDLEPRLQGKLLRALEEKTFFRVGGTKQVRADVRLIAATNRVLNEMVESGAFRRDLYYRVNTIMLEMPPLRARPDDVPLLARHFLRTLAPGGEGWSIDDEAIDILKGYAWPGNVRELRNVIERALLLAADRIITIRDLPSDLREGAPVSAGAAPGGSPEPTSSLSLEEMERRHIRRVLEHTNWHQGQASQILGISPKTLYRKIREYDLARPG
ncbi:MAG: sigma-54-dependent Fis family transcriptional regulator [Gemmatimonadetes bacterium]|nr:sigma-54-dependent Fis family transcriptional regulator [Gemmatimonadota bacterium]